MYSMCGDISKASSVFSNWLRTGNEVSVSTWTTIMSANMKHGNAKEALALFNQMQHNGQVPDHNAFVVALAACADTKDLVQAKKLYEQFTRAKLKHTTELYTALIDCYGKCKELSSALALFNEMKQNNVQPNSITYLTLLTILANLGDLQRGKDLHQELLRDHINFTLPLKNALINMYAKCGDPDSAIDTFEATKHVGSDPITYICLFSICAEKVDLSKGKQIHHQLNQEKFAFTTPIYTSLMHLYCRCNEFSTALGLFSQMKQSGLLPNHFTYSVLLLGCTELNQVKQLHKEITDNNLQLNAVLRNSLVRMYCQFHDLPAALQVHHQTKLDLKPDSVTYTCLLTACAQLSDLTKGVQLHREIKEFNIPLTPELRNALLNMYGRCEQLETARKIYEETKLQLKPDVITYTCLLNACSELAMIQTGKYFHSELLKSDLEIDPILNTVLLTFYGNCGCIDDASAIFTDMQFKKTPLNLITWCAIIAANARNGRAKVALQLFEEMQRSNVLPNYITFSHLLSACSHNKLCEEALHLFDSMQTKFSVVPDNQHYNCMIDVMARAGDFAGAEAFLKKMDSPDSVTWMTLLGAARSYKNIEKSESYFREALFANPTNVPSYVLIGNTYARNQQHEKAWEVRSAMKKLGLHKIPGQSCIEVDFKRHCFTVGDTSHPQSKEIYAKLDELNDKLKQAGFKPDTSWVLLNVPTHQKEKVLCYHR